MHGLAQSGFDQPIPGAPLLGYSWLNLYIKITRGSLGDREILWEHEATDKCSTAFSGFPIRFMPSVAITRQKHKEHV